MSSDDENEETSSDYKIEVIGSDIYYYGDITRDAVLEFIKSLKTLELSLMKKAVDLHDYTPSVRVHIHSDGGSFFSGMSAMDAMRRSKLHITTVADGTCCSAATFLLLGGDERRMGRHSHILIHQISTGFFGKFRELKDELDTCKKLMKMLKKLYKTETSIPKDVLKDLMKRDIYLDAEECLKYRIVGGLL